MGWDAVGAIGEILGALAVVLTLFYLSKQVRENSKQLGLNSLTDIAALFNDAFLPIYNNEQSMRIWAQGLRDSAPLNEVEAEMFSLFMLRLIRPYEVLIEHHLKSSVDASELEAYTERVSTFMLSPPGGRKWLQANRSSVSAAALEHLDRHMSRSP